MNPLALAQLVESSEGEAYRALAIGASTGNEDFVAQEIGGGIAIVSSSITTTLNLNRVIGLGVYEPATLAHLDEIEHLYGSHGLSFGLEIGPCAQPPDLLDWVRARRIRRGVQTAMLYRETQRIPAVNGDVHVRAADASEVQVVADICCDAFRMPSVARRLFKGASNRPEWRLWLAWIGDLPAGAALSYVGTCAAWLGWDATVPSFRGRGVQTAMIARRLQDARNSGCTYATSETSAGVPGRPDPSFRNYERMGFALAYNRTTYVSLTRGPRARA